MLRNKRAVTMVIASMLILAACGAKSPYKDGTFEGTGEGKEGPVKVAVAIQKGKITNVTVLEHKETPGLSDSSIKEIPEAIIKTQGVKVDTISGATMTSNAIIQAVTQSLEKAK
jgi:uncharacterized protein with FMN-binding domain